MAIVNEITDRMFTECTTEMTMKEPLEFTDSYNILDRLAPKCIRARGVGRPGNESSETCLFRNSNT